MDMQGCNQSMYRELRLAFGGQDIMNAIAAKLERYRNPWQELRLQYGANKGKAYTGAPGCRAYVLSNALCTHLATIL